MAGIPEQRCERAAAEAQAAEPAALGAADARFMRRAIELAWRGWGWLCDGVCDSYVRKD